jgi:hypothetical protein
MDIAASRSDHSQERPTFVRELHLTISRSHRHFGDASMRLGSTQADRSASPSHHLTISPSLRGRHAPRRGHCAPIMRTHGCQIASNRDPPFASNIDPPCAGWNPPGASQCDNQDENAPPLSLRSEGVARPRERQRRRAEKFLPLQWRGAGRAAACGNWRKV